MVEKNTFGCLSEYVDYLQSQGEYAFTQKSAKKKLECSAIAIRTAAKLLINKKRIRELRYAFYLIIPLEYQTLGAPPSYWYIDALMQYHHHTYYVALLSAAALYNATHDEPQILQVITNKSLRAIIIGQVKINFIVKKDIQQTAISKIKIHTGYINVSTPENTAFDLVHYSVQAGHLNNVVIVLAKLAEKINQNKLLIAAKNEKLITIQRTGYLLAKHSVHGFYLIKPLSRWLKNQKIYLALLNYSISKTIKTKTIK